MSDIFFGDSEIKRELTRHYDGLGLTELCKVGPCDDPHPVNGAHHHYAIWRELTDEEKKHIEPIEGCDTDALLLGEILFQRGPRGLPDSTPGILDGALLSVLIDRFECFQEGPFACPENDAVLSDLCSALEKMKVRARERAARGVLGKNEK